MKKIFLLSLFSVSVFLTSNIWGQTLNNLCQTSFPFCTGITYNNPAGVNSGSGEVGADYGCLYSTPNPAWYYLQIEQAGDISIDIHSVPQHDLDFICWGPFTNQTVPCVAQLNNSGVETSHWNSTNPHPGNLGGYPSGNTVDCSYNSSYQEWCYIPNALPGQYYIFLITNYSNTACNIIFNQVNAGQTGAGSTFCGPVAAVSGNFYFDANSNSIKDSSEIGLFGGLVYAPSCGFYTQSDNSGNYNAYICASPDTIWSYYNTSSPYINTITPLFYELSSNTNTANFAVTLNTNVFDISTILTNYTVARPGFYYNCMITTSNIGTEQSCGNLTLTYDSIFDYISSTPPADVVTGNTLIWNNICIPIFQNENFELTFHLDSTISIGTPYYLTTCFNSLQNDTNIFDNCDTISGGVVGSYDPNDKQVEPSGLISFNEAFAEQELEYTIRFQNTGTASAINISIIDTLSNWLQVPTFTLLSSSHPCTYNISEFGIVQFTFANINLPDMNTDEPGSHGFVKFKVRCKPSLAWGGNVYNTAHIYFDYNLPIVTNTAFTYTKVVTTNIPDRKKPESSNITLEPNPATDIVNVTINYSGKEMLNLEVIDAQGRIVLQQNVPQNKKSIQLNISGLDAGSYTIRTNSKDFSENAKLIVY